MSVKPAHILGRNGRYKYTALNSRDSKRFGFSKLRTKELLKEHKLPTADIYHVFESPDDLEEINWETIPVPFVIKPASGSAGKGIWVIKEKLKNKSIWKDINGNRATAEDLTLHTFNILDGEFSTWGSNHKAIVEEMIPPHPTLGKYAYQGTPDIRIIVFNSVPIIAMARIPTKESHGKANLDQGAIGLGIDMASGATVHGVQGKKNIVTHFPNSKKKVRGIVIPFWEQILEISVQAANAAGYEFMGADLFIHPEKGPMIVELNGFPGLSIQIANRAGLKRRLERVEGLEVLDPKHGVKISQALFARSFSGEIPSEDGPSVISHFPVIKVYDDHRKLHKVQALVNTGRHRSAISQKLADKLGLLDLEDLLWRQKEGIEGKLPVIEVKFRVNKKLIKTAMVATKRLDNKKHNIELGRKDTQGFLIGDDES